MTSSGGRASTGAASRAGGVIGHPPPEKTHLRALPPRPATPALHCGELWGVRGVRERVGIVGSGDGVLGSLGACVRTRKEMPKACQHCPIPGVGGLVFYILAGAAVGAAVPRDLAAPVFVGDFGVRRRMYLIPLQGV
jgi:hypothetical protein